jgi:hypothetical protein
MKQRPSLKMMQKTNLSVGLQGESGSEV